MAMHHDRSSINGWGADLDPRNRPAVPMERTPPRLEGAKPGMPESQAQTVEVLHSIERPGLTPVYGTTCPPSGLSGVIRRRAFKRSESDLRHWMLLMLADRVNVVEGLIEDVRKSPRANSLATVGVVGIAAWLMLRKR